MNERAASNSSSNPVKQILLKSGKILSEYVEVIFLTA